MSEKGQPLVVARDVVRQFALPRTSLLRRPEFATAVAGVNFEVLPGKNLGIVGESGSGKTTLARLVMALDAPTSGSISVLGQYLHQLAPAALRVARRDFQMVFQDPFGSLDPRMSVMRIVTEPLDVRAELHLSDKRDMAQEMLAAVGLRHTDLHKYPHEFSGGQRQRIAIARALITRPKLIVADEPVSALDVSIQAQVLNLMMDMQDAFGVTYILISHDLSVVHHICPEVAVMYRGKFVETGPTKRVFSRPQHPYTQALVRAVPTPKHASV